VEVELVDFVSIATRDARRAVEWYREVLGLPESTVTAGEIETPNVTLSFWEPEREGLPLVPTEAGIAFRVQDVAAGGTSSRREASNSSPRRGIPASATSPRSGIRTGTS
jgi:catechol 2,3-dioxygenase-like lactoylglutathione lyase family enzyme